MLYNERYSSIPATAGVFESLKYLNDARFAGAIFLISKCNPWAQEKILIWLQDNDFYKKTGISEKNVLFCRERHEKAEICVAIGVTCFIDDRLEVLAAMESKVPHLFLYEPDQAETDQYRRFLPMVTVVENWAEVVEQIDKTCETAPKTSRDEHDDTTLSYQLN
ncbi:MAG: hypothetical protein P4M11_09950 [Candidatus Pacebacteria bacterium]|nr:hypothetical protein [Candidatus Paceibacterota bacterium]